MGKTNDNVVKVYSGQRAWYELALAAVFFMAFLYPLLLTLYHLILLDIKDALLNFFDVLCHGIPGLAGGLAFATTKAIRLDTVKKTIISYYCVGPFTQKIQTKTMTFEYISIYLNTSGNFETNLWCEGNKHYQMYEFYEKEDAFKFAEMLSAKLKIDLLDATEKGNSRWVDIPKA